MVGFSSERIQNRIQHPGSTGRKFRLIVPICSLLLLLSTGVRATDGTPNAFDLAYQLTHSGAYSESLIIYDRIIQQEGNPHDKARALFLSGVIHHLYINRLDDALHFFSKVLTDYPNSPSVEDALFHSGVIFYEQEKNEAARKAFLTYIQKYPLGIRKHSAKLWYDGILRKINTPVKFDFAEQTDKSLIRVMMATGENELRFFSNKSLFVYDLNRYQRIYQGKGAVTFRLDGQQLTLNNRVVDAHQFRITTDADAIQFKTYQCRGGYHVSAVDDGLQAVNYVSLEQYLYGIVPKEMPYTWDADALMAQAVASRTYALYHKSLNKMRSYDVVATMACQVYGGIDVERASTNQAVDATKGLVVTYRNRLIAAYFHANSAGHTEDAKKVWDVDMPYLKGIPDSYSKNLPDEDWRCTLSYEEIAKGLSNAGYLITSVSNVSVVSVSEYGRILGVQVMTDAGPIDMSGGQFRHCLNPMRVKSTKFRLSKQTKGILLQGKGAGHGVGMSQWGANQMAKEGFHYTSILAHYYPGSVVKRIDI